jgi:hypothetical protein
MTGVEILYIVIAVAAYFLYTRRMEGGRKVLGAVLWPALLVMTLRDAFTTSQSSSRRMAMSRRDKGIEREVVRSDPPPEDLIKLTEYGGIDSAED